MKRAFGLLALAVATSCAHAQATATDNPAAHGSVGNLPGWGPAPAAGNAAGNVNLPDDGRCQAVRYGDIVHFTLHIENVDDARRVFTEIQLTLGHPSKFKTVSLPIPSSTTLGGGGFGARDPQDAKLYHFSFVVPDVASGIYRTAGFDVRAAYTRNSADPGVGVALNRHAAAAVRNYCLAVFGNGAGDHRLLVTDFLRNPVEHPAVPPEEPLFH
jgi:hypothetical protein